MSAFPLYFHYGGLRFWSILFFVRWTYASIKGPSAHPEENWIEKFHLTVDESQLPLKYNHDYQKTSDFEEVKKTTVRHIAILTIGHSENKPQSVTLLFDNRAF